MTQYLILIYEDEAGYATATPEVLGEVMQEHNDFSAQVEQHGAKILGGEALQPTGTATSVRGGSEVTDGPFVETKEALGGYYLIEAPDLDTALAVGKLVPGPLRRGRGPPGHDLRLSGRADGMTVEDASAVAAAVADAHRREWAFVLAATVRVTRDLDVAEECAQDAFAAALTDWRTHGIPARPGAWLTTAAKRRALNVAPPPRRGAPVPAAAGRGRGRARARRPARRPAGGPDPRRPAAADRDLLPPGPGPVGAGRAHPAADVRPVDGRGGPRLPGQRADDGRADHPGEEEDRRRPHPVPGARRRRAARAGGRRPLRRAPALHDRAHDAGGGRAGAPRPRRAVGASWAGCCAGCCRRTRPSPGCWRCCCSPTPAGRPARRPTAGCSCSRSRTARGGTAGPSREGVALVREALRSRPPTRYALQAAIAAVHAESPSWDDTDWREIVALYDVLTQLWPSPVVALNRAVAVGFARGAAAGLAALDALAGEPQLAGYGYLPAARADFLRRLGRVDEARQAYEEALLLTENAVERDFLAGRLRALSPA